MKCVCRIRNFPAAPCHTEEWVQAEEKDKKGAVTEESLLAVVISMWPIYLIAAKFLKMEEEMVGCGSGVGGHGGDGSHLREAYGDEEEGRGQPISRMGCDGAVSSSRSHFIDVPHIRQLCNWDCGLACVLMVLQTLGFNDCNIHDLEDLCCTTSIWTVDLAYLLKKFSVAFSFFTVTLGANPDFSSEAFYKEQLHDDLRRVNRLFEKALDAGICIQHMTISGKEISFLILSGRYIAIALVDKYKLNYSWLKDVYVSEFYDGNSNYIGERFSEIVGSPYYMAPEVLKRNYGPEIDIWSAGVILFILLCGVPPFWAESEQGVAQAILRGTIDFKRDPWPSISENAKDLVRQMLEPDPKLRLTAKQVLGITHFFYNLCSVDSMCCKNESTGRLGTFRTTSTPLEEIILH